MYGGKPQDVPKALQSVNMKNTSEPRREGPAACGGVGGGGVADTSHFAISVWPHVETMWVTASTSGGTLLFDGERNVV